MKMVFFWLVIFFSIAGRAQPSGTPLLAKTGIADLEKELHSGYRVFVLTEEDMDLLDPKILKAYMDSNEEDLYFFLPQSHLDRVKEQFSGLVPIRTTFNLNTNTSPEIVLAANLTWKTALNRIAVSDSANTRPVSLCKELTVLVGDEIENPQEAKGLAAYLTEKAGIIPDFFQVPDTSFIGDFRSAMDSTKTYQARVLFQGKDLQHVGWKEFPNIRSCGVYRTASATLTPQKRGFMFSPDIYNFTDRNTKITGPKIFRAFKYDLEEELRYWLPLGSSGENLAHPGDKSTYTDLSFVEDPERGEVASFNGHSSYIDIRSDPEGKLQEISITAWIKPGEVNGSYSLIGKGEAFSAKIFYKKLQFTTPAIKDHATFERIIEPDVWSHIAFVYMPGEKLYFYLNGELVEQVEASDIRQTDHALTIGTNIWGQYYSGLLSDLRIWNRALSNQEVKEAYEAVSYKKGGAYLFLWFLAAGLLLIGLLVIVVKRKLPRKNKLDEAVKGPAQKAQTLEEIPTQQPLSVEEDHPLTPIPADRAARSNSIQLLNGFKIWSMDGEDITYLFSPKKKELLILILLYTIKEGGITSKKLSDLLWPGHSAASRKNNRSTQIKKIRDILKEKVSVEIVFDDKKWRLEKNPAVQIDLFTLEELNPFFLTSKKPRLHTFSAVLKFAQRVSTGPLLPQMEWEWLDTIKSDYNNAVLDLLTPSLENFQGKCTADLLEITQAVLVIDPLYEMAVRIKVQCLIRDGKHMSASKVIEHYKKLYESVYNEPIDPEFLKFIK